MNRTKIALSVAALISVLYLVGCGSPGGREVGLAETAPKMSRLSDLGWYAACGYETRDAHVGPWIGPLRSSKADAMKDALAHDRRYPGHRAEAVRS